MGTYILILPTFATNSMMSTICVRYCWFSEGNFLIFFDIGKIFLACLLACYTPRTAPCLLGWVNDTLFYLVAFLVSIRFIQVSTTDRQTDRPIDKKRKNGLLGRRCLGGLRQDRHPVYPRLHGNLLDHCPDCMFSLITTPTSQTLTLPFPLFPFPFPLSPFLPHFPLQVINTPPPNPPQVGIAYSGYTWRRNSLTAALPAVLVISICSIQWFVLGYSLAYGPGNGWFFGSWTAHLFHRDVLSSPVGTIPAILFSEFQLVFEATVCAIAVGGFVERGTIKSCAVFIALWSTFIYCPLAHMVWGGGVLGEELGVLDFAGGEHHPFSICSICLY